MRFVVNTLVSALIIAAFAEISRRSSFLAAVLVSLPLTSIIALSLVYIETGDVAKVSQLSTGILLLVAPSLVFFFALPAFLRLGLNFWAALGASAVVLVVTYAGYSAALRRLGVDL